MTRHKLLDKALASPANVRFGEMVKLVEGFGFRLSRVSGSHHICVHPDVKELVNLQDVEGRPTRVSGCRMTRTHFSIRNVIGETRKGAQSVTDQAKTVCGAVSLHACQWWFR